MSNGEKEIDRAGIYNQLNTFVYIVGDLEGALDGFPSTADAGEASDEISGIVATLKKKAEAVAVAERQFSILTLEVVDKLLAGDEEAAEKLKNIEDVNFDG